MSHTTSISAVKISSIEALRAAVAELNMNGIRCELKANETPRAYYSEQSGLGRADYVLRMENSRYDVGFYRQEDDTYEARADFWASEISRELGSRTVAPERRDQAQIGKLLQLYAVHAATEAARRKGLSVRRIPAQDGKIKLELTGANL